MDKLQSSFAQCKISLTVHGQVKKELHYVHIVKKLSAMYNDSQIIIYPIHRYLNKLCAKELLYTDSKLHRLSSIC